MTNPSASTESFQVMAGNSIVIPQPQGSSGWWLRGEDDLRTAAPMAQGTIYPADEVVGFTYDPAAVLAWISEGKLP
jgi:hypothetical protein